MIKEMKEIIFSQKNKYKTYPEEMFSAYNREIEVKEEYNGRQILELLQNADDEKSRDILIELNSEKSILIIANKGKNCSPFSIKGLKSLMISNLSSKTDKNKFIGNKGLGFRSVINWADKITIFSNNIEINFSRDIVNKVFDELFDTNEQERFRKERNLSKDEKPIPFLSIPEVKEHFDNEWTTKIVIQYKKEFEEAIKKQINLLRDEILLFLNNIQKLDIKVDNLFKTIKKDNLSMWKIYEKSGKIPNDLLERKDKTEKFELKIAIKDDLKNDIKELFAYFPTKIEINLPFIVHGTFDLNTSRNDLNYNEKNKFILKQLVELIVDVSKEITEREVSYKPLEMLSYSYKNNRLEELDFYNNIDIAVRELEIFPCVDCKYRKLEKVIFDNQFAKFVTKYKREYFFKNLLIPVEDKKLLYEYELNTSLNLEILQKLSAEIEHLEERVDFIYFCEKRDLKVPILIDEENNLIINEEVYTPTKYDIKIPKYVRIRFLNKELFNKLIKKFDLENTDNKARELQRILKKITNIHSYEPVPVLQKIVSTTNKKLEANQDITILKEMVKFLFYNYLNLDSDKTKLRDVNVQLLDKNKQIKKAQDLFLSKSYPSGKFIEYLFENIFDNSKFLIDIDYWKLDEDKEKIEEFFIWLGVNKYTKFKQIEERKIDIDSYVEFVFDKVGKPQNYRNAYYEVLIIENFKEIVKKLSKEKLLLWILKDTTIKSRLEFENNDTFEFSKNGESWSVFRHSLTKKPSAILYQIIKSEAFRDYYISSNKYRFLINDNEINYSQIEKYGFYKADIDSLILKIGGVDDFTNLSIEKVKHIIKNLQLNSPQGDYAQSIYKLALKHYEKNNITLNEEVLLFAKKGDKKGYYYNDKIYYSGNKKLPTKILKTILLLDYPRRQNSTKIKEFFGLRDINEIKIEIISKEILKNITYEFNDFLDEIKKFIFIYRSEKMNEKEKRILASTIKNLKISLCNKVCYKLDEKFDELEEFDYLKDDNQYLVKISLNFSLNKLRNSFEFQESFADILGIAFDITDTHIFRSILKDDIEYTKKVVLNDFGEKVLEEAEEFLGNKNINFIEIHKKNLKQEFEKNYLDFRKKLYTYCLKNDKKSEFIDMLSIYNKNDDFVEIIAIKYSEEKKLDYLKFVKEYIRENFFDFDKLQQTEIDFDFIYSENEKKINVDEIENRSLLYFEKFDKREIENRNIEILENIKDNKIEIKDIKEVSLSYPSSINKTKTKTKKAIKFSHKKEINKQKVGKESELIVYETLIKKYGKENVFYEARDNDNLGYDIKYQNENTIWKYVEVKTYSNGKFYISKNEKEFAKNHKENYELFLVGDEIYKIEEVDFENGNFNIYPREFIVEYKIKKNK